jgi:F0F1-type ATP synthase epsilon subunit
MGLIRLDDAQPGMVLATEVRDRTGRLLMAGGQELTDRALRIFRMWGVVEIDVQGVGAEAEGAGLASDLDPAIAERAQAQAEALFRHTDQRHPVVAELMRLATRRIAERMVRHA